MTPVDYTKIGWHDPERIALARGLMGFGVSGEERHAARMALADWYEERGHQEAARHIRLPGYPFTLRCLLPVYARTEDKP